MGRPRLSLGIVIQARMGSSRLPGKVLMPIGGKPLLGHVVGRARRSRHASALLVATSGLGGDDPLAAWCAAQGVDCFRGSELDVLDRYYRAAADRGFDPVVRLTGDNPFTDIEELDRLIDLHLSEKNDFTHSFGALPIGAGAELFSFAALERSHREGRAAHHREHVDEYLLENPALFRTGRLEVPAAKRRPDTRLTVDTEEDYRRACFIVSHSPREWVGTEEAIELCSRFA